MEVFSYGNGDFLFQIFTAVTGLMGDGSFSSLVRISILFGFIIVIYQVAFSMDVRLVAKTLFQHYMIVVILFYALFVPKTDVVIRDEIKDTQVVVNNVPYGVGLFAHFFTTAERGVTRLMEQYFSTPTDMKFAKTGYAFSAVLIDTVRGATPKDPYFKRTMNDFVVNCFFHDVLWGDKNLNVVIMSNNILTDMMPQHSAGAPTPIFDDANPSGVTNTCDQAYGIIVSALGTQSGKVLQDMNKVLQIDITTSAGSIAQTLLGVSADTTGLLTQAITANALKEGFSETAMYTGVSAGATAYASGLAEMQQRSSWAVSGEMAKKYIPLMRQILEAFVYGLFPILFIMMMSPFGTKILHVYFTLLMWLFLWSPLFAILNLIINIRFTGLLAASNGYFSLGTMPYIYQSANDIAAIAGNMAWSVPILAFAIAKGSDYAMVSLASGIGGAASHSAGAASTNISSAEGAQRTAAQAQHMEAAAMLGADNWSHGQAAGAYMQIANGMALAGAGQGRMSQLAHDSTGNQMFNARADAISRDDQKEKYGTEDNAAKEKGTLAGVEAIGRQEGFKERKTGSEALTGQQLSGSDYSKLEHSYGKFASPSGGGVADVARGSDGTITGSLRTPKGPYHFDSDTAISASGERQDMGSVSGPGGAYRVGFAKQPGEDSYRALNADTGPVNATARESMRQAYVEEGSKGVASRLDWNKIMSQDQGYRHSSGAMSEYSDQLRNSAAQNLHKGVENDSSLKDYKDERTGQTLEGALRGGGDLKILKIGGGYKISKQISEGTRTEMVVSGKAGEDFRNVYEAAQVNAVKDVAQRSSDYSAGTRLAAAVGASESQQYFQKASDEKSLSADVSTNIMPAYLNAVTANDSRRQTPEGAGAAFSEAAAMIIDQGTGTPEQQAILVDKLQTFARGYISQSPVSQKVDSTVTDARNRAEEQAVSIKSEVDPAAASATAKTRGISDAGMPTDVRKSALKEPDVAHIDKKHDDRTASFNYAHGENAELIRIAPGNNRPKAENITGTPGQKPLPPAPVSDMTKLQEQKGVSTMTVSPKVYEAIRRQ